MDYVAYFDPVDVSSIMESEDSKQIGCYVSFFDGIEKDLSGINMVIIGVPESRNAVDNQGCEHAPDVFRKAFYRLYPWQTGTIKILDMGNLKQGKTINDTYIALTDILAFFIEKKIIPIILGGSNDLAYSNYRAYEKLEQLVNIVAVDSRFDIDVSIEQLTSRSYLNYIIMQQPNYLLYHANIGYQTYLNSPEKIDLMNQLYFDMYRVGMIRQNLVEVEPIVRNADMFAVDISAVRRPDAPGNKNASANGFYGEEICQVCYLAGLSDKLTSIGLYEFNPLFDYQEQTAELTAHMIWYFIEGYLKRQGDTFFTEKENYLKYSVAVSGNITELVFYCSKKTKRWWMLVPVMNIQNDIPQNYYLPCSQSDYDEACNDKIPEKWWSTYHKLNR